MSRLFISYARADGLALAQEVKRCLEELGHDVFLDVDDIPGGEEWEAKLREQVACSDVLVALVTPLAKDSSYVFQEFDQAKTQHKLIIPVVYTDTALPGYLQKWNAVFIRESDWKPFQRDSLCGAVLKIERSIQNYSSQHPLPPAAQTASRSAARPSVPVIYPVTIGILAVLGFVLGGLLVSRLSPTPAAAPATAAPCAFAIPRSLANVLTGEGDILAPETCTTVFPANVMINMVGTYHPDIESKALWLMAYTDGKYWPQAIVGCQAAGPYRLDKNFGT